jgi:dTDP-D-glucose 4,6-dehydratase
MQTNLENLILVTGGAEFIGSNFILQWIEQEPSIVLNLDKLTYAGSPRKLESVAAHPGYRQNVRDWLYVEDHCSAIRTVLSHGRVSDTCNIGDATKKRNLEIVDTIGGLLDELRPRRPGSFAPQLDHIRQGSQWS